MLTERLCKLMSRAYDVAAITNEIYTKEDAEFLTRHNALPPQRIMGVETGAFKSELAGRYGDWEVEHGMPSSCSDDALRPEQAPQWRRSDPDAHRHIAGRFTKRHPTSGRCARSGARVVTDSPIGRLPTASQLLNSCPIYPQMTPCLGGMRSACIQIIGPLGLPVCRLGEFHECRVGC